MRIPAITPVAILLILHPMPAWAQELPHKFQKVQRSERTSGLPNATLSNINRVAAWYSDDGEQEREPLTGNSGLTFPRLTAQAIYSSGILWSGKFYDGISPVLRTNGQVYNNGTKPGRILGIRTGVAEDPNAPDVRIWRIRRDYATADLRQDAAEYFFVSIGSVTDSMIQLVRDQYATDWTEWPWQKGAPFYDLNGDRMKDPDEDPGLVGADQVVWYVCNDIAVNQPWACPETGIEEQTTIWGYNRADAFGNVIFKRFRLLYKGTAATAPNAQIDSMYLAQWSDVDLGAFSDDLAGCDTALDLGYCYNGNPIDNAYQEFGLSPPAVGYDLLQGPVVPTGNPADTAIFDFRKIPGARNLPMTAFIAFISGSTTYTDPPFNANGVPMWNQMLRGFPPRPQGPPDPPAIQDDSCRVTKHMFSGDPVTQAGWLDGGVPGHISCQGNTVAFAGDRRFTMASGPFTLALGDSQEFVVAFVGGLGANNLNSVSVMKSNATIAQQAYDELLLPLYGSMFNPSPPTNVRAYSDYSTPTTITLNWTRPTTLVGGGTIGPYVMRIKRDGIVVAEVASVDSTMTDGGLTDGTVYTYTLQTRLLSNDSLSVPADVSWTAGGSRVPGAPTNLSIGGNVTSGYTVRWVNPSAQSDGTPLDDFAGLKVYRDSVVIAVLSRTTADTGRADSLFDAVGSSGHFYFITSFDNETPTNESQPSTTISPALEPPFSDGFPFAGQLNPSIWIPEWVDANDRAANEPSLPYSLNLNGAPFPDADVATSQQIDLTGRQNDGIFLSYNYQPKGEDDPPEAGDSLTLEFKNDLGVWKSVRHYPGLQPGEPTPPFRFDAIALAEVNPGYGRTFFHTAFQFRFWNVAESDFSGTPLDNWFIDDVSFEVPSASPTMVVDPLSIIDTSVVEIVDSTSRITILNTSTYSAPLSFSIAEDPSVPWLAALPSTGSVQVGGSITIVLQTDFSGQPAGTYNTSVIVSGNDSANTADTVSVSYVVTLAPSIAVAPDSFFFALNGGDSATASVQIANSGAGPLRYRSEISGALTPENVGSSQNTGTFSSGTLFGNVVQATAVTLLLEFRAYLNISTPRDLRFLVYENTAPSGTYTKIFESFVPGAGPGTQFYSSGPVEITLDSGKYYAIGVNPSGGVQYAHRIGAPIPSPLSFGTVLGRHLRVGYPSPENITVSPVTGSLFYAQLITSTNTWLVIESGERGTVFPGDSAILDFRVRTRGLPMGGVSASIIVQNNDPQNRAVRIPVALDVLTGFVDQGNVLPERYALMQNYPNPFNPVTTIRYELPRDSRAVLKIYNLLGQEVATLVEEQQSAGRYQVEFHAENLATGIYFYRLRARQTDGGQACEFTETKKLLLLK